MAIVGSRSKQGFVALHNGFGSIVLQPSDIDRLDFLVVVHTGTFAKFLGWAHLSAGVAKPIGFVNGAGCSFYISGVDLFNKQGDIDVCWTSVHTRSIVAIKATRAFVKSLRFIHERLFSREVFVEVAFGLRTFKFSHTRN